MTDILLTDISKSYGEKVVLADFSARFPAGVCTCLMGPSGCGKTTLLRILLRLEIPDGGTITGLPVTRSAVFQEDRLFEDFSALSNVSAVCDKARRQEVSEHLTALGLGGSLAVPVRTLSGGMKRRVAIARAVLAPGELLVLDEPFTGLDQETKDVVLDYLKEHIRGRTVVLVTHDSADREALGAGLVTMTPAE